MQKWIKTQEEKKFDLAENCGKVNQLFLQLHLRKG